METELEIETETTTETETNEGKERNKERVSAFLSSNCTFLKHFSLREEVVLLADSQGDLTRNFLCFALTCAVIDFVG